VSAALALVASLLGAAADARVSDLASVDPAARRRAFDALSKSGAAAVPDLLEGFAAAPPLARELRARLLREAASAGDLERVAWSTPSPPPHHNYDRIPVVRHGPHEFNHPKVKGKDWLGQWEDPVA
jgi:hypothetical protein